MFNDMTYTTTRWGPDSTPTLIRYLLLIIGSLSIFSALTAPLMEQIFALPSLDRWLSLSWYGINHYQLWRPFTYFFVESGGYGGVTLSFMISLAFDLYLIWVIGSDLIERVGQHSFFRLFMIAGILSGIIGLLAMKLFGLNTVLVGPAPVLLALFTVWTMFHPEKEIWILLLFQVKTKWLLAFVLAAIVLINLSQLNGVYLTFYLTAAAIGYIYGTVVWGVSGPYAFMGAVDGYLIRLGNSLRRVPPNGKIFDFQTGKPVKSDDEFMDEMLEKIARRGPNALTRGERARMDAISAKKRNTRS